jgi:hypothetical protein
MAAFLAQSWQESAAEDASLVIQKGRFSNQVHQTGIGPIGTGRALQLGRAR